MILENKDIITALGKQDTQVFILNLERDYSFGFWTGFGEGFINCGAFETNIQYLTSAELATIFEEKEALYFREDGATYVISSKLELVLEELDRTKAIFEHSLRAFYEDVKLWT